MSRNEVICNVSTISLCRASGEALVRLEDGNTISVLIQNKDGENNIVTAAKLGVLPVILAGPVDTPAQRADTLRSGTEWTTIYTA